MQRREFLWASAALAAGAVWPATGMAAFKTPPDKGGRSFEETIAS